MGMKKRIRKLIGLQETFIDLESSQNFHKAVEPETPPQEASLAQEVIQDVIRDNILERLLSN